MAEPSFARLFLLFFSFLLIFATYSWVFGPDSGFLFGTRVRKTLGSNRQVHVDHSLEKPHHPLDPLTVREINRVRTILSNHDPGFGSGSATIHSMALDEPEKSRVVQWKKGNKLLSRRAAVVAYWGGQTHEITVDLDSGRVVSDVINRTSGYPILTLNDVFAASQVPLKSLEFNRSIEARGVKFSDLACITPFAGWFGSEEEGRRVIRVQCFTLQGTTNYFMRPLEGLYVTVDLDKLEVIKIIDKGPIPIPKASGTEYRFGVQNKPVHMDRINPISMEQPDGPSFRVEDGHLVKWANWVFHVKADQRAGSFDTSSEAAMSDDTCTTSAFDPHLLCADTTSEDGAEDSEDPYERKRQAEDQQAAHSMYVQSLLRAFDECDASLPEPGASEGGSTATVALVGQSRIWVANCGDSRAMVARHGGHVVELTDDHKPERPDETARVQAAGGHVFWNGCQRVMGVLSMSRALGDRCLKQYGVISTPEITCVDRTPEDDFLLLASDGVWACLSNAEAVALASACVLRAQAKGVDRQAALRVAAQVLVRAATQQGSSDNITVVLFDLQQPQGTAGNQGLVSQQAAAKGVSFAQTDNMSSSSNSSSSNSFALASTSAFDSSSSVPASFASSEVCEPQTLQGLEAVCTVRTVASTGAAAAPRMGPTSPFAFQQ